MAWRLSPWLPHIVDKITKPDKCTPKNEEKKDDYVPVEYESPILGIVDDEEFWFPPGKKSMVEYRSASQIGNFDFDANRKRIKVKSSNKLNTTIVFLTGIANGVGKERMGF
ncbi:uncharacterized protein [Gossypium hirsutum]|uniref:Uncharacterized protein n=1 Tax=Gossypium hirsutum TaxID=3635 RepID=A0A1U8JVJ4_GOSHI|nr:uncharacterized protein LOC107910884 [Gossypium hirsutum]